MYNFLPLPNPVSMEPPPMTNFFSSLSLLPSQVGGRNAALLPLVRAGLREGFAPEALVAEIVAGSGSPPLSAAEVRRAVDTGGIVLYNVPCITGSLPRRDRRS